MSNALFNIYYSGPALESGSMDVRELAPALLSVGKLIEESNRVLNSDSANVTIRVKRFEDGSFGVSLEIIQSLTKQLVNLLSGDSVTSAANLLGVLGFFGVSVPGLFALLKKAKGRSPKKVKILQDGNVEIEFDNEAVQTTEKVLNLYRDLRVRKEVENTVKPLEQEGIEHFEVRIDNTPIESVEKKEIDYFRAPEVEEQIVAEYETTPTLSIHSLSFKEDNKWRLSDGTNTFFVTISDHGFLQKVDENLISFAKGDLLKVKLKVKTWETESGLKTEYEAQEVLNHKSAARQIPLPFE